MKEALAFRHEFYKEAQDDQIRDDIISYLGEYRFETPEYKYSLGLINARLADPHTGELMLHKAKKAVAVKMAEGLGTSREEAEFEGILNLEEQLKENPLGTIVWFSPPGPSDYGFAYVGKRASGHKIEMTAIRLEKPEIKNFNKATLALWDENYKTAEEFIKAPKVLNIDLQKIKEFIHGSFQIRDEEGKNIFQRAIGKMNGVIEECVEKIKSGTRKEKEKAFNVLENLAIESKKAGDYFQLPRLDLANLMNNPRYVNSAPAVIGSCGISKTESNLVSFRTGLNSKVFGESEEKNWDFDQPGPCRLCGADVSCGPCKICKSCNDKIDSEETLAVAA